MHLIPKKKKLFGYMGNSVQFAQSARLILTEEGRNVYNDHLVIFQFDQKCLVSQVTIWYNSQIIILNVFYQVQINQAINRISNNYDVIPNLYDFFILKS